MSSRALKKIMKERGLSIPEDELLKESVGGLDNSVGVDEDENDVDVDDYVVKPKKKSKKKKKKKDLNPFDALLMEDEKSGHHECEPEADVEEKIVPSKSNVSKVTKTGKSKGGKGKGKGKLVETTEEDDVDAVIREINEQFGFEAVKNESLKEKSSNQEGIEVVKSLLLVEKKYLSAELEMKRIFGSRIVTSERDSLSRNQRNRTKFIRKTYLVQFKSSWPKYSNPGIHMILKHSRTSGGGEFQIEHSKEYQSIQRKFLSAVNSLDPRNIGGLLNMYPYHIDSLLQLSEVFKINGDSSMATEMVERAVYCFEMCFHTLFNPCLGACTMDYKCFENRGLFIALLRYSLILGQKGCWRTALEFTKVLLGLDPDEDPMGTLLVMDFFALQSGEFDFLLRVFVEWENTKHLTLLPNLAYSIPLAMFLRQKSKQKDKRGSGIPNFSVNDSDELLQKALLQFPMMIVPSYGKVQYQHQF